MEITASVVSEFRDYYPEFEDSSKYSDNLVNRCLFDANEETGGRWGRYDDKNKLKQRGMFAFAAHMLVMRSAATAVSGAGGIANVVAPISSKTVADESTSYAVVSPDYAESVRNGSLGNTFYGQEFLRLRSRIVGPMFVC